MLPTIDDETLTARMIGIGMMFDGSREESPDLEETIMRATMCGMEDDDYRVLSLAAQWLETHAPILDLERIGGFLSANEHPRTRAFWCAIGQMFAHHPRFTPLTHFHIGGRIDLIKTAEWGIKRNGEDPRFAETVLRVQANTLRRRPSDVLTPSEMMSYHAEYRRRSV